MPIYVYKCKDCGCIIEKMQPINHTEKTYCEICDKEIHKIIVPTSFSLQGDGWYKDGYSKNKKNNK